MKALKYEAFNKFNFYQHNTRPNSVFSIMQSVKLSRITIPHPTLQSSPRTEPSSNPENTFSIKVKYLRERSPTANNPLDGLFDYSQVGKTLEETLPAFDTDKSIAELESTLISELKRQGIHQGKYKLSFKPTPGSQTVAPKENIFRITGFVGDVAINHGHFLDNQKLSETGNSVENLDWVIKLDCSNQEVSKKLAIAFHNPTFDREVATLIKEGLGRGDALELVNEAIKKLVQKRVDQLALSSKKIVFALKRRGALPSAVVVIGQTHLEDQQPPKQTDRVRKYHPFSF